jgi:Xaa-Pro aminopeptidase
VTPDNEITRRLKAIRARMKARSLDLLVIYSQPGSMRFGQRGHVMYVSGHEPYFGDTMVLLPRDESLDPLLELDAANYYSRLTTWIEKVKPAGDHVRTLKEYLHESGLLKPKIGLVGEYSMSPALYSRFLEEVQGAHVEVASDILEAERAIKSEYEVGCMKQACAIAHRGMEAAARFARPGVLEAEIIGEIERVCRAAGSEFFPHHTMVTSGKDEDHGDLWWKSGRRRLEPGEPWLLDFGTMYEGYCCDLARPFILGEVPKAQQEVFDVLLESLEAGRRMARPGVRGSELMQATSEAPRRLIGKDLDWWGHGHGVGLEVHEWPFVGYERIVDDPAYRDVELRAGMVISLEPTLSLLETGALQVEDQFVVTEEGGQRVSPIPLKIFTCGPQRPH